LINDLTALIPTPTPGPAPASAVWAQATSAAGFSPRLGQASLFYNNQMWIFSGGEFNGGDNSNNGTWNSQDGTHWSLVTANDPFQTVINGPVEDRLGFSALVFNNRMWLLDGTANLGINHTFFLRGHSVFDRWGELDGGPRDVCFHLRGGGFFSE
jgi:hypothetical protein